ncbi:F-box and WD repeat domain containing protein 10B [Pagrus major]|uniref:F-box and WD repeat domain containing protein 10B n=1 Tax=Pagrus major TaxID=143350 RepID=UPI003CC8A89E
MKSTRFGRSVSACELSSEPGGCVDMCGMCPSCAFAPRPPGSSQCVWKVSDGFRRRFVLELILRCRDAKLLQNIQRALGVTSWSLFTYSRSRSPNSPPDHRCRSADRERCGSPAGVDVKQIWDWFGSSPDWIKSRYLCRVLSFCDPELLRMVANLTSVLLVRQRRGFLQFNVSGHRTSHQDQDSDGDSDDPALMVVPGSSKSVSGVSRYRDFIGCLPVDLSKRILGLLDEHTLRCCQKVSPSWQHLAQETLEEIRFRGTFQHQIEAMMKSCRGFNIVSPTYASIVQVPVPVKNDGKVDVNPSVNKVELFEAAYAEVETKTVQMEERNVYCGAYFTTVLLNKEDPHRVMDYRGRSLMATGSKDRTVQLFYVASETKVISVMKGHVGRIRAVLLCQDRNLLVTASCDASIRCWNLKTDKCVMVLYGHTGTVNCLDVHADRLVSGAKDCKVKVWSLHTGKLFEDFNFKHRSPVQCVKISSTAVYSSCNLGLIKVWDMETASLLRVINAHRKSVMCLFLDEWHLLSGDCSGQVMAWSLNGDAQQCLMTFKHPKEVKSLTLVYLRVVTGCVDGKIRIFNFLTGDCLREITAEAETGQLLSLHFHDNSILVNTTSSVKRFQFAKVFWDYTTERSCGDVSDKSAAPLRKLPLTAVGAHRIAQVASPNKKPGRAELPHHTRFLPAPTKSRAQARERCVKESVVLSEKATCERIKKRGLHHPLTRDSIVLRVNAIQRAQCTDEVSINMERNARLRDSWGPRTSQDPLWHTHDGQHRRAKTCVPILKRAVSQNVTVQQGRAQPHRALKTASGFTATEKCRFTTCSPERSMKTGTSFPRISQESGCSQ